WRGWAALAACAAVVVLAVTVLPNALGGRKTNAGLAAPAAPAAAGSTLMTSLEAASESEADAAGGEADAAADEAAVNSIEESLMVMQSAPTSSPGAERKAERREADLLLYGESAEFWLWNNCELDEEQEGYWVYRGTLEELPDGLTLGTPEMVERWNKSGRDFAFVRSAEAEGVK
ncbi:MAG: hypothetical protein IJU66_00175, partial [Oscillospiraceae bacterium]|nr:hypothetical protein [Oscillospiraceae bacterium]